MKYGNMKLCCASNYKGLLQSLEQLIGWINLFCMRRFNFQYGTKLYNILLIETSFWSTMIFVLECFPNVGYYNKENWIVVNSI